MKGRGAPKEGLLFALVVRFDEVTLMLVKGGSI